MSYRLKELDFLRGIAIILVLLRHFPLFGFTTNMGWIGVDLFFVLSGFLVSGLLFKEYLKFGTIEPTLFLVRRGFKIYPVYYIFYLPYLALIIFNDDFKVRGFLSDMTFTQNYLWGWGYAYPASWSLAVEEHFYFGLTFLLWLLLKYDPILKHKKGVAITIISLMILCLVQRILGNIYFENHQARLFTLTQLRVDSLLSGVLISYFYHFKQEQLIVFFKEKKILLITLMLLGLSWTPFIEPLPSFFAKTIGFSLLYISFGILLVIFLLTDNIVSYLNKLFSKPVVNAISKIGFCSYSIYVIHSLVMMTMPLFSEWLTIKNHYVVFFIGATVSILTGMIVTYKVEKYFLTKRDKYFPSRV